MFSLIRQIVAQRLSLILLGPSALVLGIWIGLVMPSFLPSLTSSIIYELRRDALETSFVECVIFNRLSKKRGYGLAADVERSIRALSESCERARGLVAELQNSRATDEYIRNRLLMVSREKDLETQIVYQWLPFK